MSVVATAAATTATTAAAAFRTGLVAAGTPAIPATAIAAAFLLIAI